jgi:hypothetical protein
LGTSKSSLEGRVKNKGKKTEKEKDTNTISRANSNERIVGIELDCSFSVKDQFRSDSHTEGSNVFVEGREGEDIRESAPSTSLLDVNFCCAIRRQQAERKLVILEKKVNYDLNFSLHTTLFEKVFLPKTVCNLMMLFSVINKEAK